MTSRQRRSAVGSAPPHRWKRWVSLGLAVVGGVLAFVTGFIAPWTLYLTAS